MCDVMPHETVKPMIGGNLMTLYSQHSCTGAVPLLISGLVGSFYGLM